MLKLQRSAIISVLVGVALTSMPLFAQNQATAPKAPAKTTNGAKPTSLDSLRLVEGDEKGNDLKSLKAELLVSATEQKAIKQLNMLIRKYKGTPCLLYTSPSPRDRQKY